MIRSSPYLLLVAAGLAVGAANAHSAKHDMMAADVNRDGKISRAEYHAARRASFERLDIDGNSRIDHGERSRYAVAMASFNFDLNWDGVIEFMEIHCMTTPLERPISATCAEAFRIWAYQRRLEPRLDANEDGQVTRAEFDARSRLKFGRLDGNGDGFLDRREASRASENLL